MFLRGRDSRINQKRKMKDVDEPRVFFFFYFVFGFKIKKEKKIKCDKNFRFFPFFKLSKNNFFLEIFY